VDRGSSEGHRSSILRDRGERIESWNFGVDPDDGDGAIAALTAIQDHEVPAHSRMDLLIAQHATDIDEKVLRAIARLFASSQFPDRIQAPNGEQPGDEDEDEGSPSDILQFLEEQAAAGKLFLPDLDLEPSEPRPEPSTSTRVPPAHHLTGRTLTSVHIRTIRAYAETLLEHDLVRKCNDALGPPMNPLVWALDLRRQLAGLYNAWFMDGVVPLGHWTAHAWRKVALASGRFFHEPDDLRSPSDEDPEPDPPGRLRMFDPLAEAQALLHEPDFETVGRFSGTRGPRDRLISIP
jgi:hypothetical protein